MIKCDSQVLNHINFNATFECFLQIFKNVVNLHAPVKNDHANNVACIKNRGSLKQFSSLSNTNKNYTFLISLTAITYPSSFTKDMLTHLQE